MAEMEHLVKFGQALGESLTVDSIADVAAKHLPSLSGGRAAWAMVRSGTTWHRLPVTGDRTLEECEIAPRFALGDAGPGSAGPQADFCFPMIAAGAAVGLFAVASEPALSDAARNVATAVAPLLAVSLKNAQRFHSLLESTVHDALTGCANRAHAMAVIDGELSRSRRSKLPLSLLMFDLNRFKEINDQFGHLCGDAVLTAVGKRMSGVLRASDLKCRYGGEEFLVLLPDTGLAGAERLAELLRSELDERPVRWNDHDVRITASFGATAVTSRELDVTAIIGARTQRSIAPRRTVATASGRMAGAWAANALCARLRRRRWARARTSSYR